MTFAHAEAVKSINSVVENKKQTAKSNIERGDIMVELDQFKTELAEREKTLIELRDSL